MQKSKISTLVFLFLIGVLLLAACSPAANPAPAVNEPMNNEPMAEHPEGEEAMNAEDPMAEEPAAQEPKDEEPMDSASTTELPTIPDVNLGENWFRPTNPADIQLASGQVQVFKFSAVW